MSRRLFLRPRVPSPAVTGSAFFRYSNLAHGILPHSSLALGGISDEGRMDEPSVIKLFEFLPSEPDDFGFDLPFEPTPDHRFKCPICLGVLRTTLQTNCGHRFCAICLKTASDGRNIICPLDKKRLNLRDSRHVFQDRAYDREIMNLRTRCSNLSKGCNWIGELRNLEDHLKSCTELITECPLKCGTQVVRDELEKHMLVCSHRLQSCTHCDRELPAIEMPKHQLLECPTFPVVCNFCGSSEIQRGEYEGHVHPVTGNCPGVVVPCVYGPLGCTFQDQRGNISRHYETSTLLHSSMAITRLVEHSMDLHSIGSSLVCNWRDGRRLNNVCLELQRESNRSKSKIMSLTARLRSLETVSHDGNLLWKVDMPQNERLATVYSPHFYLGTPGYRFIICLTVPPMDKSSEAIRAALQLTPNGSHPSLFYPINGSFKVSLLHQGHTEATSGPQTEHPSTNQGSFIVFKIKMDFQNLKVDAQDRGVEVILTSRERLQGLGFDPNGHFFLQARVVQKI